MVVTLSLLSGCAKTTNQAHSGFLNNYQGFVDSDIVDYTKVYRDKDFTIEKIASMEKVKLVPFEMWVPPGTVTVFTPEQLHEFSMYFHQQLNKKLTENNYQIVHWADKDTITIRGAFSGVKFDSPELSPTDFIPFRIAINAGNLAYLELTEQKDVVTKVSLEIEFLQGRGKHRMLAAISSKYLEMTVADNGDDNVKAVQRLLDNWADRFVERLVDLRASHTS